MSEEEALEEEGLLVLNDWDLNPRTGIISINERTLRSLMRSEPIEHRYVLDSEPIARGQFAVVYHCTDRTTGKEYAAKFSSRVRLGTDCTGDIIHEIAVSAMLRMTPRAIHLVDVFSTEGQIILVMEYAPGGDLQTLLDEDMVPYERDVVKFMRQLLEGLIYIHDRSIVHLDIKPQNLVLMGDFPDCAVKLCDFEISRMVSGGQQVREILGTPDYVAPEILLYEPITTKTDMWSVGVLTYVLLTGFLPFGGESDQETFMEILKCELDFPSELFEDITPEAIDFIKKLLIRKPEQRMSARESLNHVWMRKGVQRPSPPTSLNLISSLNSHIPLISQTPDEPNFSLKPSDPVTPIHLSVTRSPSDNTRLLTTPSKDIGRPPVHPFSSQRSLVGDSSSTAGTPVVTPGAANPPFVYRQESKLGSRHNLEKLRSMSKSREVISERLQMSNMKKCLSKSRERLCDARYGVSKSREQLMTLNSLSQSVEALSALSHFAQQNLFQSCNNIFVPKIRLPEDHSNSQERMYQSMAAIDQIDNMNYTKGIGFFESSMSLNNQSYNDMVTQHNTNMNIFMNDQHTTKPAEFKQSFGLRGNTCKGGRTGNASTCESRCSRQRHHEQAQNQKVQKLSNAERIKKDAQRKRKEKREREKRETAKLQKEKKGRQRAQGPSESSPIKSKPTEATPSPVRRGSVCHVEQRLQERHERNQEKLERLEREERKNKRRVSVENERNIQSKDKPKSKPSSLATPKERTRSLTPTRRNSRKEMGDVSQATSLESVMSSNKSSDAIAESIIRIQELKLKDTTKEDKNNNTKIKSKAKEDEDIDSDEAYVSLEEPSRDYFISRCKSTESASSDESERTVVSVGDTDKRSPFTSDEELNTETLSVTEKIQSFENGALGSYDHPRSKISIVLDERCHCDSNELPVIAEESTSPLPPSSPIRYRRSISNTSDLSSLMSESSEGSDKDSYFGSSSSPTDRMSPEIQQRSRSFSTYSSPFPYSYTKSRSGTFNQEASEGDAARPWGSVCSGSVARAIKIFNNPSIDIKTPSPGNSPSSEKSFSPLRTLKA